VCACACVRVARLLSRSRSCVEEHVYVECVYAFVRETLSETPLEYVYTFVCETLSETPLEYVYTFVCEKEKAGEGANRNAPANFAFV